MSAPVEPSAQQFPAAQFPPAQPPKKKGGKAKWIVLAVIAIIVIAVVSTKGGTSNSQQPANGGTVPLASSPGASAPAAPGAVGQAVAVSWGSSGKANVTVNEAKAWPGDQYVPPKNGTYVALDVTIEATAGKVSYNPLYWSARDADGHEYNFGVFAPEPTLKSGELAAGEKVRGWIAFDVPKGSALTVFLDDVLSGHVATWSVKAA